MSYKFKYWKCKPCTKIGKIIKSINTNVIYSIDACQSIGHINVDVKKLRCDVLIGSGRKFLRGPRGTGFIFLRKMKIFNSTSYD